MGKSTLLRQVIGQLHQEGVSDERVLYVDMLKDIALRHGVRHIELLQKIARYIFDIPDNYPKFFVSMDTAFGEDLDGIRRVNPADFLIEYP